jgi:DNA-binding PadR family transcriptional regulator
MLGDGDLRLIVLTLLARQQRHGTTSSRRWKRAPTVYSRARARDPTLTYLEKPAARPAEGNKKVYAITDAGRAHLASNRETADVILSAMEEYGAKMAKARAWYYRHEEGGTWDIPGVIAEVNEARRALKGAIAESLASGETQRNGASFGDAMRAQRNGDDLAASRRKIYAGKERIRRGSCRSVSTRDCKSEIEVGEHLVDVHNLAGMALPSP